MTITPRRKPSILSIGKVLYSVSVLGIWGATDTSNIFYVFHLVVRASTPLDAAEVAVARVKDHVTSTGGIDGLASISAVAVIPGRHPNLAEDVQKVGDEDDGSDPDFPDEVD